jgi:hypothetical protein
VDAPDHPLKMPPFDQNSITYRDNPDCSIVFGYMPSVATTSMIKLPRMPIFFFSATRYHLPMGSNPLFVIAWAASGEVRNLITE